MRAKREEGPGHRDLRSHGKEWSFHSKSKGQLLEGLTEEVASYCLFRKEFELKQGDQLVVSVLDKQDLNRKEDADSQLKSGTWRRSGKEMMNQSAPRLGASAHRKMSAHLLTGGRHWFTA